MTRFVRKIRTMIGLMVLLMGLYACGQAPESPPTEYVLKTADVVITPEDFSEELDLKQSAYPYNLKDQPDAYNEMVIHLVKVLSEEIILLSEAAQKQVEVTDADVENAEMEFKKDYPEDSFDQMLLKNAISYAFWKERFRKNLIIDRLIDQELTQKIEISSSDIVNFYKQYETRIQSESAGPENQAVTFQDEKQLVSRLRRQKTQEHYEQWIQQLWEKYPVEINQDNLKKYLIDIDS